MPKSITTTYTALTAYLAERDTERAAKFRRTVGITLTVIAVLFAAYALTGCDSAFALYCTTTCSPDGLFCTTFCI